MVLSPGNMVKTESMWNSSTHAMNDISALAYRRNVPTTELIVPVEVGESDQTFQPTRNKMFQTNFADASWNKLGNGRGRGALLHNRDVLHRNDQELKKQLRIANGFGYSNDLIEAKFKNSSSSRSLDGEETVDKVAAGTYYDDDDLSFHNKDEGSHCTTTEGEGRSPEKEEANVDEEEEDISIKQNGEWNWEKRTAKPPRNRVILKNVALQSLKRQKQKAKPVEEKVPSDVVPLTDPPREQFSPYVCSAPPKVKEDWRAEIRATQEEARRSQIAEGADLTTTPKVKKGWRSGADEPLLGNLKIESNWSVFAPNVTPPPIAEDNHSPVLLPRLEPGQQTTVESPPKGLLELSCLDLQQRPKRNKKKKNQNIRIMYVPPAERSYPEANVAPPGYLMPNNGVSPMAIRNSEYNPLTGQNIHRTFGNLFGQTIKQLGTNNRRPYKTTDAFSLANDEFPQLK